MVSLTKCNSTILSTRSASVLNVLSELSTLGISPSSIVFKFHALLPKLLSAHRQIVTDLSLFIGEMTNIVNEALINFEKTYSNVLQQFKNRFVERRLGRCAKIDFEEIMKCTQLLTNTMALIAETAINDCGCATIANDTYDAIVILNMILIHLYLAVQGINVTIGTVLYSEKDGTTDMLHSRLLLWDPFIHSIADNITSMTNDIPRSVRKLLKSFVRQTSVLNGRLTSLLGSSQVKINKAQIKRNLLRLQ